MSVKLQLMQLEMTPKNKLNLEQPTMTEEDEGGGLRVNDLPTEMLSKIFSFCRAIDLLAVQTVCSKWRDIVQSDQGLWNHILFSANDLDVKTTASLLREMPLVRSVELCNIHSPEDMTFLVNALSDVCWQLHRVHFPENCIWHPSAQDLHQLSYYHPRVTSLQLCTKQKLTASELENIGIELSRYPFLNSLVLIGFYWHQPELFTEILSRIDSLRALSLPSIPGLTGPELAELSRVQPNLERLTINTSSLTGRHLKFTSFRRLRDLRIIDNSNVTTEKAVVLSGLQSVTSLDVNLGNCSKNDGLYLFAAPRPNLLELSVSNCGYSDELLTRVSLFCPSLRRLVWHNPKETYGELSDDGLLAITKLPLLHSLQVKSRSITKTHYPTLAAMRSLHYARINGMKVPGCL